MSETVFHRLHADIRNNLQTRGFTTATEPQKEAIPPLMDGENGLVIAPTGSGKTETAMLPVFDAIYKGSSSFGISALYITPLRALNRDMRDRLEWWGNQLDIEVDVRHGDTSDYQRQKQADNPPDVLITTPETLQAMLTGSKLRKALSDVEHVIVDEVHELASAKRGAQLTIGLERLRTISDAFQRIGLSATVGDPKEVGAFLTGGRGCEIIEISAGSKTDITIIEPAVTDKDKSLAKELMTEPEFASQIRRIHEIVEDHDSTLIFVNTRQTAEALGSRFREMDANIGVHHGSLSKGSRIDIEDKFKAGEVDGLLCTSSMELGIDVGRIDHVIQYQSPREVTRLLQRVGRAGHRNDIASNGTIITSNPDDTFEAMAIARRALNDNVENTNIHYDSLDTVANQTVGLVIDNDTISARLAYEIITSAYPFRDLDESTFKDVITELDSNRVIWLDEEQDQLEKTGGTWQYYYANLSMIPDEETYVVHNMATDTQVGTLDERFVVNFAEPGETFIQGGKMWRIVEIEEEQSQVNVSPIEDPAGEIPSWVGEEIPVPYAVAQEVGEIRDIVANQLQEGASLSNVANELPKRYPLSSETANRAIRKVVDQIRESTMVPTDDRIVIEREGRTIIINACFGHKVNETLGRVLSALLGQRTGSSIGLETDPYRIELETPGRVTTNDVIEILETTDPDHIATIIELSLQQSDTLKFTLSHIAAKFGALKRWKGGNNISSNRLISMLEETPIHEEAVREIFQTDLAITETQSILHDISDGDIDIVSESAITPIGGAGRSGGKELLAPENADASVVSTIKDRIMNDRVRLFCTHCKEWDQQTKVKRIEDQPQCPNCDSTRIAALSPWADEKVQAIKASEKTDEQEQLAERGYRNASLVQGHGKQAVIALQGRGVGPQNAARIINNHRENENDFYRDILEREREYARTKSFWD